MRNFKISMALFILSFFFFSCKQVEANTQSKSESVNVPMQVKDSSVEPEKPAPSVNDTALYDSLQLHLVGNKPGRGWPVKSDYPLPGAIFPYKRVIAYYGNFKQFLYLGIIRMRRNTG